MTELNIGDSLKVEDVVKYGRFEFIVIEIGEFALARHRNITLMLPTVYDESFIEEDEFGFTHKAYRN